MIQVAQASNTYIVNQTGNGNTAMGDQSDPTVTNNLIVQTQNGDNNTAEAEQIINSSDGVIIQI
ncbi:hypothetical protein BTJ40_18030 [Microbulbifer sp. A4B17]|uniref:hypothetical protein n=1 Tax=Microbulbifer sp. A4B17 TaxID=359370 RepID=UPI000D52E565|nr:hypothetical protein [Microbulbifer sp. A4B17]AWF82551.1 hypothetical protein BTJ40_18030 [Microbulbifer sp. A4B17]